MFCQSYHTISITMPTLYCLCGLQQTILAMYDIFSCTWHFIDCKLVFYRERKSYNKKYVLAYGVIKHENWESWYSRVWISCTAWWVSPIVKMCVLYILLAFTFVNIFLRPYLILLLGIFYNRDILFMQYRPYRITYVAIETKKKNVKKTNIQ